MSDIVHPGLVTNFARKAWESKAETIPLDVHQEEYSNTQIYLLDGQNIFGVITFSEPLKVGWDEFETLSEDFTREEVTEEFGVIDEVFLYPIDWVNHFRSPLPYEIGPHKLFMSGISVPADEFQAKLETIALIKDIKTYDPSDSTNEQLADDLRISVGWYAVNLDPEQKIKFSKDEIVDVFVKIVKEIVKRKRKEDMVYSAKPEEGSKAYRKLWEKAKDELNESTIKEFKGQATLKLHFLGTKGLIEEEDEQHKEHSSLLLSEADNKILIDWGESHKDSKLPPDIDAILITHAHVDHAGGLDGLETEKPVFVSDEAYEKGKKNLQQWDLSGIENLRIHQYGDQAFNIPGFKVDPVPVTHSINAPTWAFKITSKDKTVFYAPDVAWIPNKSAALRDVDIYIGDGSSLKQNLIRRRDDEIFGHAKVSTQLSWCDDMGIQKAIFTHFGKEAVEMDDRELRKEILTLAKEENLKSAFIATDDETFSLPLEVNLESYASIRHKGDVLGSKITYDEIMDHWKKPIVLKKGIVTLTGGVVNNNETMGDIDTFIRYGKHIPERDIPLEFRLARAVPEDIAKRLHFNYDEYHGVFTPHSKVYDLVLMPSDRNKVMMQREKIPEAREKEAMEARDKDEITLGEFFFPLKPFRGFLERKAEDPETIIKEMPDFPMFVEKKYDGVRCLIARNKDDVKVFSDSGDNLTDRFPSIVKLIKELPQKIILDAEITAWNEEKWPREEVAGYTHAETKPDDSKMTFNIFDIVYLDDPEFEHHELSGTVGDLHKKTYDIRQRYLEHIVTQQKELNKPDPGLNLAPALKVTNKEELKEAVLTVGDAEGSEGGVVKYAKSTYELDGVTREWIKFKEAVEVHAKAIGKIETKTKGVFNYELGIPIPSDWEVPGKQIHEFEGKEFMYLGRSFNTDLDVKVGTILSLSVATVFHYTDDKEWMTFYGSKITGSRPRQTETDSAKEILETAEAANILEEKEKLETSLQKKFMTDEPRRFVWQHHATGKSIHADFRWEVDDILRGFTVAVQKEGAIKEPIVKLDQLKKLGTKSRYFKYDRLKTYDKFWSAWKSAILDKSWLDVEGVFEPEQLGLEPGNPSVFNIVDQGELYLGKVTPEFWEFFMKGDLFQGRYVARLIRTDIGLKPGAFIWNFWKTEDHTPYVLSDRAKEIDWVPPKQVSALPPEIREQIPDDYKYWEFSMPKRLEVRNELINKLETDEIEIQLQELKPKPEGKGNFVLQNYGWRGPLHARAGPTNEYWKLRLDPGKGDFLTIRSARSMLNLPVAVDVRWQSNRDWLDRGFENDAGDLQEFAAGDPENPTKATPLSVFGVEKGKYEIKEFSQTKLKISLENEKLSGTFELERGTENEATWLMRKSG